MIRIPRCYVCGRLWIPRRYGHPELHVTTADGTPVEQPVRGHPDCLVDLAASTLTTPKETPS